MDVPQISREEFVALCCLYEQKMTHLRELLTLHIQSTAEADRLSSDEIARRLDELNHAHSEARENWSRSLPRELFESTVKEWDKWRSGVDAMAVLSQSQSAETGNLDQRVLRLEAAAHKVSGALILIGLMGAAGVIAFAMALLRVSKGL